MVASILLRERLHILGLALAFSLAMMVQLILLWLLLRRSLGSLQELKFLHLFYKISLASLIMGVAIQPLKEPIAALVNMNKFWGIATQGGVAGTLGLVAYILIAYFLKTEELLELKASLKKRWLNFRTVKPEITEV